MPELGRYRTSLVLKELEQIYEKKNLKYRQEQHQHASYCCLQNLEKFKIGYSSQFWRRSIATNLANAGVSLLHLKRHGQWDSGRKVEGYMANSLPLRQELLNCLLPVEERNVVGQENSKKIKQ